MSHQEIPMAVAEIVSTSNKDKNSYDRELEQRIESVLTELQKNSEQVEGLDTEIRTLKTSLEPLLGCKFIRRIEEDSIWSDPTSIEFDTKFLQHEIPAVANVAILVKQSYLLKDGRRTLAHRLEQLREDQLHNNYIPAELFRFIEDLRGEVVSLRSMVLELTEEKRSREEKESEREREKERKMKVVFQFDTFSAGDLVAVTRATDSCTLIYSGHTAHNYAISSSPLRRDGPSRWQVDITSLSSGGWVMLGIIGNLRPANPHTHTDSTCYAWACSGQVYCPTGTNRSGSWAGWQVGDRGVFTYDPAASTLALTLVRGDAAALEYRLDNCVLPQAYIHVNFHPNGTSVRFSTIDVA